MRYLRRFSEKHGVTRREGLVKHVEQDKDTGYVTQLLLEDGGVIQGIQQAVVDEYNRQAREETESTRDFIILHYHATRRNDTEFWNYMRTMSVPDTLRHRIELFRESGMIFLNDSELFRHNGWSQVLIGQGFYPQTYQAAVGNMDDQKMREYLLGFKEHVASSVARLPTHEEFLERAYGKVELA